MSYHLKLKKALSYCGVVEATKQHPDVFVADKAIAEAALASGYFNLVQGIDETIEDEKLYLKKTLEKMTIPELETFAAYKGISLKGINKKPDIIAEIKKALPPQEIENEVDYGSPTMVELQE